MSLKVAGAMIGVGKTKINELCAPGALERKHIGRRAVVAVASILRFIDLLACPRSLIGRSGDLHAVTRLAFGRFVSSQRGQGVHPI